VPASNIDLSSKLANVASNRVVNTSQTSCFASVRGPL